MTLLAYLSTFVLRTNTVLMWARMLLTFKSMCGRTVSKTSVTRVPERVSAGITRQIDVPAYVCVCSLRQGKGNFIICNCWNTCLHSPAFFIHQARLGRKRERANHHNHKENTPKSHKHTPLTQVHKRGTGMREVEHKRNLLCFLPLLILSM